MKTHSFNSPPRRCRTLFFAGLSLWPTLALAHPGHHHPGEEDEFDALQASFLHLHGNLEISLALLAVASVVVFTMNRNRPLRVASVIAFGGALAFLAAH